MQTSCLGVVCTFANASDLRFAANSKGEDARTLDRRRQLRRRYATIFAYAQLANRFTYRACLSYNFYELLKSQCHCKDNFVVNVNRLMPSTLQRRFRVDRSSRAISYQTTNLRADYYSRRCFIRSVQAV